MSCKGICKRYKAKKLSNLSWYGLGQKRCQVCEIFIKWEGRCCPCCGYRLRTKPRNKLYKEKLRETILMLISCPTGCTQKRTKSYRLAERKTFNTKTNKCSNCAFSKVSASGKFHGAGFRKASELGDKHL